MFVVDIGTENGIGDLPSTRHLTTYELACADGHNEQLKWLAAAAS